MRMRIGHGYEISRLIKGGWQLAGGHGSVDPAQALRDMAAFVEAGITTFDCADIYTGVEELIGRFRLRYPSLRQSLQVHTKFVPDLQTLGHVDAAHVERSIDRSIRRLGVERLDLVQFHWWDYTVSGYVEAALELLRLRDKGKIAHIGVTNFDVPHLLEIIAAGVPIISQQLQYSLLDARPRNGMTDLCRRHAVALLAYGTIAGGFLSERWLGQPAPGTQLTNRSLIKYRLIIEDFGGWELFQQLLATLQRIAIAHDCGIATVASRAVLDWDGVAAVIIGAINAAHLPENRRIADVRLSAPELAAIDSVLQRRKGPAGDVFTLERDPRGRHGRIMKYDLHEKENHAR
ncbi:MAG TPA: aldo/keto reductase [Steroidobacteraceae bacterium]